MHHIINRRTRADRFADLFLIATSLRDFLVRKFPLASGTYEIADSGLEEQSIQNELLISIHSEDKIPEKIKRAMRTLVKRGGAQALEPSAASGTGPLYFVFRKASMQKEGRIETIREVVLGFRSQDFDAAQGMRQVGELIGGLDDETQLGDFAPEELENF